MKKNQNKKGLKKIILLFLLFVGLGAAITAGAYWVEITFTTLEEQTGNYVVQIGQGDAYEVETQINITGAVNMDGNTLVPDGHEGTNKVSTISFDVIVKWDVLNTTDSGYAATGQLDWTEALSVTGLTPEQVNAMFEVTFDKQKTQAISFTETVTITVTVTFKAEPANQTIYNSVKNKALNLDLTFSIVPDPA